MLFIISAAKSLNKNANNLPTTSSIPNFLNKSSELIDILKELSIENISSLMNISHNLSILNHARYQDFKLPFNNKNSLPALFTFNGDVYNQIKQNQYNKNQLQFAQNNLRILSGLYGVLKPLDLMQPYRLEMGTKLKNNQGNNLYQFWSNAITKYFNKELEYKNNKIIVNLASNEYSKVINNKLLNGKLLNITFMNKKNDAYKNIGIFAKRARGMMSNFIIENKINNIEDLKLFNESGYIFQKNKSDDYNWFFFSKNS